MKMKKIGPGGVRPNSTRIVTGEGCVGMGNNLTVSYVVPCKQFPTSQSRRRMVLFCVSNSF